VPRARAQLDLAEFLHSQATPNTTILGSQRLDTITTSSKLIAEDVEAAELSPPNMRAKQSRLSIIDGCYRLPVSRRKTEEFINLTHTVRFGRFRRHTSTGYVQLLAATQGPYFYDPVLLGPIGTHLADSIPFACPT